jgi:hypothetical protein
MLSQLLAGLGGPEHILLPLLLLPWLLLSMVLLLLLMLLLLLELQLHKLLLLLLLSLLRPFSPPKPLLLLLLLLLVLVLLLSQHPLLLLLVILLLLLLSKAVLLQDLQLQSKLLPAAVSVYVVLSALHVRCATGLPLHFRSMYTAQSPLPCCSAASRSLPHRPVSPALPCRVW